ncbi:hypothetical protein [Pseudomonas sp. PS02288]|uniref:hypothetical protein n=1 Tax=Pseudomonas sp. PS02288 TaxID=2991443 RepID=UPI00249BFA77|nr:hypothetical protein [Pseudomonas sp. PS02288]
MNGATPTPGAIAEPEASTLLLSLATTSPMLFSLMNQYAACPSRGMRNLYVWRIHGYLSALLELGRITGEQYAAIATHECLARAAGLDNADA